VLACDALSATPTDLEKFAAHLWQMADGNVGTYEVTGATAGGGYAFGEYHVGPPADRIRVTFTSKPSCTPDGGRSAVFAQVRRVVLGEPQRCRMLARR
jgi:hypothetical protein